MPEECEDDIAASFELSPKQYNPCKEMSLSDDQNRRQSLSDYEINLLHRHNIPLFGIADYKVVPFTAKVNSSRNPVFDSEEQAISYLADEFKAIADKAEKIVNAGKLFRQQYPEYFL